MTGELKKILTDLRIVLYDADMHPLVYQNGFQITVNGTKALLLVDLCGDSP